MESIAQIPAEGILKSNDWGDSKMYKVVCECGQPSCEHDIMIEAEDTGVSVTVYTTVKSPWWSMNRFQQIWKLLTKGYLEHQASIMFNKQTAINYAETLKKAAKDVEQFRKDKSVKKSGT